MEKEKTYKIGVVGAGNFAKFALNNFLSHQQVAFGGVFDLDIDTAILFAKEFDGVNFSSYDELLNTDSIDLIYIATPPFLHYEQSLTALKKGKHVICEKPIAFTIEEALELQQIAQSKKVLFVVNLMQRYNPLFLQIKQIIKDNILGEFLHGYMENYASDTKLPSNHWFWNENKSGGIFIEHGVHFFDLFAGWLGKGELLYSLELHRKETTIQNKTADRVQAIVKFPKGTVNFYHGFDQATTLDRQEFRLLFEKGEITLFQWVPTLFKLKALVTEREYNTLVDILAPHDIEIKERYKENQVLKARFKELNPKLKVVLSGGREVDKEERYSEMLYGMLKDQLKWLENKNHERLVTAQNAIDSIEIAVNAHVNAKQL